MKVISTNAEAKIIEHLNDVQEDTSGWTAVAFAFSRLLEHYKSDYQLKIAINLIKDLTAEHEGTIFVCGDSNIYVLARDMSRALIDKMIFQLRYLFMDDPLAYDTAGEENLEFAHSYVMDSQFDDFMFICKGRMTQMVKGRQRDASGNVPKASPPPKADGAPQAAKPSSASSDITFFNASSLASIERDLSNADLSRVVRRQPICAAVPDTMTRSVFEEMYINIAHLRQLMGIKIDLLSNKWLFKYLTQILDERMLDMLQHNPTRHLNGPVSLNLNVHTLLSDRFMEFDASIKPAVKVSIVVELQLADVFADMAAFLTAKDTVQNLGYRVCLDGVTDLSFTQIDRKKLGFDLIKLQWNADIQSDLRSPKNRELSAAIKQTGANRVILTRCDTRYAVDYGQAMGVTLFQGRHLDAIMNPKSTVEN